MNDKAETTATNYLGIFSAALLLILVAVLAWGFRGFNSVGKRIDSNELIITENLRANVPVPFDESHIPCKRCRAHLNDVASHTAALERAEVIYMLKRNRTGHAAFDLGVQKCIDLVESRSD
jgi:hypothetical protein